MIVSYIYHSGFLVETADCYYLFDYYKGELPALTPEKPILVFASHNHQDHYNPTIFELLQGRGMQQITAVLAKDIPAKKYSQDIDCIRVSSHQTYELPHKTRLQTLLSTDAGVAFLLQCPDGTIYHAGDLNDWVWEGETEQYNRQMTGSYRHEIDLLKNMLINSASDANATISDAANSDVSESGLIDVAFIPLDPRQEKNYANGLLYFLKKVPVKKVYPMHYWEKPEIIATFLREHPEYQDIIEFGEVFINGAMGCVQCRQNPSGH